MKTLSIRQPHAALIRAGRKLYEFRSWRPHTSLVEQDIAIHAARTLPQDARDLLVENDLPIHVGCIIAIAHLEGCYLLGPPTRGSKEVNIIDSVPNREEFPALRYDTYLTRAKKGLWAWRLQDVRPIEPVYCSGNVGLFDAPLSRRSLLARRV